MPNGESVGMMESTVRTVVSLQLTKSLMFIILSVESHGIVYRLGFQAAVILLIWRRRRLTRENVIWVSIYTSCKYVDVHINHTMTYLVTVVVYIQVLLYE